MALVYTTRLIWFFRFAPMKERQAPTGRTTTNPQKGSTYSLFNIFMPWAMESTRKHFFFYITFGLFHIGVTVSLLMSFIIPYAPNLIRSNIAILILQVIFGCAFIIGCMRIIRRIAVPVMRAISTPDDYFSIILLTVWFLFAFLATPNNPEQGETALLTYFFLTAFFILYVPFSKISHYLYYPFTRYYLGKSLGRRGVFPLQRGN
jgi:nitrate reductase gamma subunit